ncbi:hypothetical protein C1N81_07650 [Streptomyces sp. SGAir0957]
MTATATVTAQAADPAGSTNSAADGASAITEEWHFYSGLQRSAAVFSGLQRCTAAVMRWLPGTVATTVTVTGATTAIRV